jgi:ATP-binding cassette subfamily B protein
MIALAALAWPVDKASSAIVALARAHRMPLRDVEIPSPPNALAKDAARLGRWIDDTASWLGIESEPLFATVGDLSATLDGASPLLVRLPQGEGVLAIVRARGTRLQVVAPDLRTRSIRADTLFEALLPSAGAAHAETIDAMLDAAALSGARRDRVRSALLRTMLAGRHVEGLWLLRVPPRASFWRQIARAEIPRRAVLLSIVHALATALSGLGFWLVGRAALDGRLDRGWLAAWAVVLAAQVPLAIYVDWAEAQVAIDVGALLKRRLLAGALSLPQDAVRSSGAGELLGRVLESEAVETLALTGGFSALTALIELVGASVVLALGASGLVGCIALVAWTAFSIAACVRYTRKRRGWTESRIAMTHELTERMVGHRTRLAQQAPARWHQGEDEMLADYLSRASSLDVSTARVSALVPQAWLLVGVATVAGAFISDTATEATLAISLGGVLMASRSLRRFAQGAIGIAGARVAWEKVAPLFRAAASSEATPAPDVAFASCEPASEGDVVEAREIVFRHRPSAEPVLSGCSLRINRGDRVLVQGGSGSGKSTLASILCGLRTPQSGLVLVGGLDRATLGLSGFRHRVASAPQFHENHVLSAPLAFNLLLGRTWPPRPRDLEDCEEVCRALGLEGVLARMPSGMQQIVGETGWQLSHGEQSRLFIARALLQNPDVIVLDESLAALDPETLSKALGAVLARARTLVVIAHP